MEPSTTDLEIGRRQLRGEITGDKAVELAVAVTLAEYEATQPERTIPTRSPPASSQQIRHHRPRETQPITGNFDFDHLKRIHQFILQDVYD
ncbi:hypothetical protein LQ385_04850 [Rhodococcus qingshengii]|nr:hypothetical protein [Rhodococcus qingshengii]MCD2104415.1 hypothetical protein [Rhodococcus qingshengii]